jgi:regulator of nucleoside diphosphate kinase
MPAIRKTTTRERRTRERLKKRNDILDAAESVFRSKGLMMATTDDIADVSGISVGTIYNFFGNKQSLHEEMLIRMGERLLGDFQSQVLEARSDNHGIEPLIRFRVANYEQYLPLFQLFSVDWPEGSAPLPIEEDSRAVHLYRTYIARAGDWISEKIGCPDRDRVGLALALEGTIHTFIGFWSRPTDPDSMNRMIEAIENTFSGSAGSRGMDSTAPTLQLPVDDKPRQREIQISRIDRRRLKELLVVAKTFIGGDLPLHLTELEEELSRARIVEPASIPPDLVTMNTRVHLEEVDAGIQRIRTLVYPADQERSPENISILDPLGARLLGRRIGDAFGISGGQGEKKYRIAGIAYQPEAAGDFHL